MISIIIPTYNEEKNLSNLVPYLQNCCVNKPIEIIIADGGSNDKTTTIAANYGVKIVSTIKGRSIQMNHGASIAKYPIYYFVHADTLPPNSFYEDILQAVDKGSSLGRYRTKFDGKKWILMFNAFFTRFDWPVCYGGDQTLFITKEIFYKVNGYNENLTIMEEYELVKEARKYATYKILNKAAIISSRKYDERSWLQVQIANYRVMKLYKQGINSNVLQKRYAEMLEIRSKRMS
jgi:rSAM/selenodomain-associated transferase 2